MRIEGIHGSLRILGRWPRGFTTTPNVLESFPFKAVLGLEEKFWLLGLLPMLGLL